MGEGPRGSGPGAGGRAKWNRPGALVLRPDTRSGAAASHSIQRWGGLLSSRRVIHCVTGEKCIK